MLLSALTPFVQVFIRFKTKKKILMRKERLINNVIRRLQLVVTRPQSTVFEIRCVVHIPHFVCWLKIDARAKSAEQ
jgi:hypothetical protein